MSPWIETAHAALRYSHIAVGFAGLPLFWIPVLTKKGSRVHVLTGRMFLCCATFVGLSGLASSVWAIVDPRSFSPGLWTNAGPREAPYIAESLRFFFAMLAFLSMAVLASVVFGVAAIRTRRDHARLRHPFLLTVQTAQIVAALGLAAFGGWNLVLGFSDAHPLPEASTAKYWIPFALGGVSAIGGATDLRYILQPRPTPMSWWYKHMQNMAGVGIGFHTAILVFGASRFLAPYLPGAWQLAPWLLPAIVGLPVLSYWTRRYQKKFGEFAPPQRPSPAYSAAAEKSTTPRIPGSAD